MSTKWQNEDLKPGLSKSKICTLLSNIKWHCPPSSVSCFKILIWDMPVFRWCLKPLEGYRHRTLTGRHIYTDCLLTESQNLIQYALLCRDKMTYLFSITNPAFPVYTPMDTKGGWVDHLHFMIKDSSGSSSLASSFRAIIESIMALTYFFSSIKWCCGLKDSVWFKWCHGGGCTEVPSVWVLFFGFWLCGDVTWILLPYWTFLLPDFMDCLEIWLQLKVDSNVGAQYDIHYNNGLWSFFSLHTVY